MQMDSQQHPHSPKREKEKEKSAMALFCHEEWSKDKYPMASLRNYRAGM